MASFSCDVAFPAHLLKGLSFPVRDPGPWRGSLTVQLRVHLRPLFHPFGLHVCPLWSVRLSTRQLQFDHCGFVVSSATATCEASPSRLPHVPRKAAGRVTMRGALPGVTWLPRAPHPENRTGAGERRVRPRCEERASGSPGSFQQLCGRWPPGWSVKVAVGAPVSLRPLRSSCGCLSWCTYAACLVSRAFPVWLPASPSHPPAPPGWSHRMASLPAGSGPRLHGVSATCGPALTCPSGVDHLSGTVPGAGHATESAQLRPESGNSGQTQATTEQTGHWRKA